jgi:hypothetical protein
MAPRSVKSAVRFSRFTVSETAEYWIASGVTVGFNGFNVMPGPDAGRSDAAASSRARACTASLNWLVG